MATAYPVDTEAEVKNYIDQLWKQHYKARHICYAYIISGDSLLIRANDDGEPVHTAGEPILKQLQKYDLDHSLITVVRYFGGVLLGKGGLIRAYSQAAEAAIKNNILVEFVLKTRISITVDLSRYAQLRDKLYAYQHRIIKEDFTGTALLVVEINKPDLKTINSELSAFVINLEEG